MPDQASLSAYPSPISTCVSSLDMSLQSPDEDHSLSKVVRINNISKSTTIDTLKQDHNNHPTILPLGHEHSVPPRTVPQSSSSSIPSSPSLSLSRASIISSASLSCSPTSSWIAENLSGLDIWQPTAPDLSFSFNQLSSSSSIDQAPCPATNFQNFSRHEHKRLSAVPLLRTEPKQLEKLDRALAEPLEGNVVDADADADDDDDPFDCHNTSAINTVLPGSTVTGKDGARNRFASYASNQSSLAHVNKIGHQMSGNGKTGVATTSSKSNNIQKTLKNRKSLNLLSLYNNRFKSSSNSLESQLDVLNTQVNHSQQNSPGHPQISPSSGMKTTRRISSYLASLLPIDSKTKSGNDNHPRNRASMLNYNFGRRGPNPPSDRMTNRTDESTSTCYSVNSSNPACLMRSQPACNPNPALKSSRSFLNLLTPFQ